jgi:hypothetical protein
MHVAAAIPARVVNRPVRRAQLARAVAPVARTVPARWQLPDRVELGDYSRAQGPWTVDWQRAHADAIKVLDSIDFTKPELVMWLPGTDNHGVQKDFRTAVQTAWASDLDRVSLVALEYEATWQLRHSFPTGLATMKLVMHGIRQRLAERGELGRKQLLLAGESQGGWIIGEVMADPQLRGLVTRAITAGHPWLAKHQYADAHDAIVRTINHEGDQVAMPVSGDVGNAMDAMSAVKTGAILPNLGRIALAILQNPIHGVLILHNQLRETPIRPLLSDPHNYISEYPRMVAYLRTGAFEESAADIERARRDSR